MKTCRHSGAHTIPITSRTKPPGDMLYCTLCGALKLMDYALWSDLSQYHPRVKWKLPYNALPRKPKPQRKK